MYIGDVGPHAMIDPTGHAYPVVFSDKGLKSFLEPKYSGWSAEKQSAAASLNRPMQDYTVPASMLALRQPIVSAHPHVISTIMATKPLMQQSPPTPYTEPEAYPYMTAYRVATDPSFYEEDGLSELPSSATPLLIIVAAGLLGLMLS